VLETLQELDPEAVVGGFQTGALAYFAPTGIRVVNLDGVVNRDAYRALRERRIFAYLRERRVTFLADWGMNLSALGSFSDESSGARVRVEFAAPEQGGLRLLLARLEWPGPESPDGEGLAAD